MVETVIANDAPKGDAFFVLIQWIGLADGASGGTRVRVSFKVGLPGPACTACTACTGAAQCLPVLPGHGRGDAGQGLVREEAPPD